MNTAIAVLILLLIGGGFIAAFDWAGRAVLRDLENRGTLRKFVVVSGKVLIGAAAFLSAFAVVLTRDWGNGLATAWAVLTVTAPPYALAVPAIRFAFGENDRVSRALFALAAILAVAGIWAAIDINKYTDMGDLSIRGIALYFGWTCIAIACLARIWRFRRAAVLGCSDEVAAESSLVQENARPTAAYIFLWLFGVIGWDCLLLMLQFNGGHRY